MRIALVLLALAACGSPPSPAEVSRHNTGAYDAAVARAQARFGGAPFQPATVGVDDPDRFGGHPPSLEDQPPPTPEPLADRATGAGPGDALFRLPSGTLAFAGPTCAAGDSCGCEVGIGYVYLQRPDGQVAVVRLQPTIKTYTLEVDSCGYGCGQPSPPEPRIAADLGVTDVSAIEVLEEPFRFERVVETCANPMPRP
ncbi:MAG: hypothetical protein IPL61_20655 [Myxococcales bacterium]|nr:hypothetical protein [Myxococcales bacterium]